MIRKLLIVAGSALVLSVATPTSAWLVGGSAFIARMNKGGMSITMDDEKETGPRETRSFDLDPSRTLVIVAPAHVEFIRGGKPGMSVEAGSAAIKSLRWENGSLSLEGPATGKRGGLRVIVTGDRMPDLDLRSAGQIELTDLQQAAFSLTVDGAANVEGSGKVGTLSVRASGAGNLDLQKLEAANAKVDIAGLGNADLNVSETLDASISGAGNIDLHRKPKVLNSRIAGIGSIEVIN